MSDWERVSRGCTPDGLSPAMADAFSKHIQLYKLELNASDSLACIETTAKKRKPGFSGRAPKDVLTAVLLFPGWLLWAIRADSPEVTVMSARLADVTVQDYAATSLARMVPDSGIEINGLFTNVAERSSSFIGLDEGAAAQEFKQTLIRAVQQAK